jgi:hypothetical protein
MEEYSCLSCLWFELCSYRCVSNILEVLLPLSKSTTAKQSKISFPVYISFGRIFVNVYPFAIYFLLYHIFPHKNLVTSHSDPNLHPGSSHFPDIFCRHKHLTAGYVISHARADCHLSVPRLLSRLFF